MTTNTPYVRITGTANTHPPITCRTDSAVATLVEAGWFLDHRESVTEALMALQRGLNSGRCVDGIADQLGIIVDPGAVAASADADAFGGALGPVTPAPVWCESDSAAVWCRSIGDDVAITGTDRVLGGYTERIDPRVHHREPTHAGITSAEARRLAAELLKAADAIDAGR